LLYREIKKAGLNRQAAGKTNSFCSSLMNKFDELIDNSSY